MKKLKEMYRRQAQHCHATVEVLEGEMYTNPDLQETYLSLCG